MVRKKQYTFSAFPWKDSIEEPKNMVDVDLQSSTKDSIHDETESRTTKKKLSKKIISYIIIAALASFTSYKLYQVFITVNVQLEKLEKIDSLLQEMIDYNACLDSLQYNDCCFTSVDSEMKMIIPDCSVDKVLQIMMHLSNRSRNSLFLQEREEDDLIPETYNDYIIGLKRKKRDVGDFDLNRIQQQQLALKEELEKKYHFQSRSPFEFESNANIGQLSEHMNSNLKDVTLDFDNTQVQLRAGNDDNDEVVGESYRENANEFQQQPQQQQQNNKPVVQGNNQYMLIPNNQVRMGNTEFQAKNKQQNARSGGETLQIANPNSNINTIQHQCLPYASPYSILQQQSPYAFEFQKYSPVAPYPYYPFARSNYYVPPSQFNYPTPYNPPIHGAYPPLNYPPPSLPLPQNNVVGNIAPGGQLQATSPDGKMYLCNPVSDMSTSNIANVPGVEIRSGRVAGNGNNNGNIQDIVRSTLFDEEDIIETEPQFLNLMRYSADCPHGTRMCGDNSKCIKESQICDDIINCEDSSDEMHCSCKFRVGIARWCDGYVDCPNGEDEEECFGCSADSFNCDDWTDFKRTSTCIPLKERCDGISQCPTGKDEKDCSILMQYFGKTVITDVGRTSGYLYRNYKSKWYPTCSNSEGWAKDACDAEIGISNLPPLTHLVPAKNKYTGLFISALEDDKVDLSSSCVPGRAVYVECPQPTCGTRILPRNLFRREEVDTSIEEEEFSRGNRLKRLDQENQQKQDNQESKQEKPEIPQNQENHEIVGNSRVVGGKPSQPGSWPFVVSIYRNGLFHCGGTIVSPQWIVTAAHCMDKFWLYYYEIEAGSLRRFSYAPMQQLRFASHVVTEPRYDRAHLRNDLSILRVSAPFTYNRYVRPICLPSETTAGENFHRNPSPGTICTAVGWGATVEHGRDPDHLREVELPVLLTCKHKQDKDGDGICAGLMEGGKDACQGDSGGPFLCKNPNFPKQWYLAGVVSHGEGCARPDEPGVYTRVSNYLEWIYENARDETLPSKRPLQRCPGYQCKTTGKCLSKKQVCDKFVDCLEGDDELNCESWSFSSLFRHAPSWDHSDAILSLTNSPQSIRESENGDKKSTEATSFASATSLSDPSGDTPATEKYDSDGSRTEFGLPTEELLNKQNTTDIQNSPSFLCTNILQVVPVSRKCDKVYDCEDGTDENDCKCVDYIKRTSSEAVCDGVTDCKDLSDEEDCNTCQEDEYYCRISKECIPLQARCNRIADCAEEEDEIDCFALSDAAIMDLDEDLRPFQRSDGIVAFAGDGRWSPLCVNATEAAPIATDICLSMGFAKYETFRQRPAPQELLVRIKGRLFNSSIPQTPTNLSSNCSALFVRCSQDNLHILPRNKKNSKTIEWSPWTTGIYVEGQPACTGVLISTTWVLTTLKCFNNSTLDRAYISVWLGPLGLDVGGPHSQVIPVRASVKVEDSGAVLLRLQHDATVTRYARPLPLKWKVAATKRQEICSASGFDSHGKLKQVSLWPINRNETCPSGFKCLARKEEVPFNCTAGIEWSGIIICDSEDGLYPAAIYEKEANGECGFTEFGEYASVNAMKQEIETALESEPEETSAGNCVDFRCTMGNCLNTSDVCDGILHCSDGSDETEEACLQKENSCHLSGNCVCKPDELRCDSGKCVPKQLFCNDVDDCGDGSDEPEMCTCRNYLRLTKTDWICDGDVNCLDGSDEINCNCSRGGFVCNTTNTCIPKESVCDGNKDCPNGEDEKRCLTLLPIDGERGVGEVVTQTSSVWHRGCFKQNLTIMELEEICYQLGFKGSARYYKHGNATANSPVFGTFSLARFNQNVNIGLRSTRDPFLTWREDPNCFRLFIDCMF